MLDRELGKLEIHTPSIHSFLHSHILISAPAEEVSETNRRPLAGGSLAAMAAAVKLIERNRKKEEAKVKVGGLSAVCLACSGFADLRPQSAVASATRDSL